MKKLTLIKTVYGVSNIPIIAVDFGDGSEIKIFSIYEDMVGIGLLNIINYAIKNNYIIEFKGFVD